MNLTRLCLAPVLAAGCALSAGDLAAPTLAKFIRVIAQGVGAKSVACEGKEVASELAGLGVAIDPQAKVAWAENPAEVMRLARQGKLVICGNRSQLAQGASLSVTAEAGHPVLSVNAKALTATGLALPDSIAKIAKGAS